MRVSVSLSREAIAVVKRLPNGERSKWVDRAVLRAALEAERLVTAARQAGFTDEELRAMVEGRRVDPEFTGNALILSLLEAADDCR